MQEAGAVEYAQCPDFPIDSAIRDSVRSSDYLSHTPTLILSDDSPGQWELASR